MAIIVHDPSSNESDSGATYDDMSDAQAAAVRYAQHMVAEFGSVVDGLILHVFDEAVCGLDGQPKLRRFEIEERPRIEYRANELPEGK